MSRYASFKDAKSDLASNPNAVRDFLDYEVHQYVVWKHALRDLKAESKDIQQKDLWDKELTDFSKGIKDAMKHLKVETYSTGDHTVFFAMKSSFDGERVLDAIKSKELPELTDEQKIKILESLSETKIKEIFGKEFFEGEFFEKYSKKVPYSLYVNC